MQIIAENRERRWPAWVYSVAFHFGCLIILVLVVRVAPQRQIDQEIVRPASIVLSRHSSQSTTYLDESDVAPSESATSSQAQTTLKDSLPDTASLDLQSIGSQMPSVAQLSLPGDIGLTIGSDSGRQTNRQLPPEDDSAFVAAEAAARLAAGPQGKPATVSLFDGPATHGHSFVIVIDRSKSMGNDGLGALHASQSELDAALAGLNANHQFQVLAYNDNSEYFQKRELVPATNQNKADFSKHFASLPAFGTTDHFRAVMLALYLEPDVIYLLTDGGVPGMNAGQLAKIKREARGKTSVHTIQFGWGKLGDDDNFMMQLARDNRGQFRYVNLRGRGN